jgi:NADPH:quinone reductase-like Zn-dependent oxidoreductase
VLFANVTVRLLGSDDFTADAYRRAGTDLNAAAQVGALRIPIAPPYPLGQIAVGVDRVVEVAFSDNIDLDAAVVANNAVIAAYSGRADRPHLPFPQLLFANVTVRLLGSDDFTADAYRRAGNDLNAAAQVGALRIPIAPPYPLAQIAQAHDHVDNGPRNGRVLLSIPA